MKKNVLNFPLSTYLSVKKMCKQFFQSYTLVSTTEQRQPMRLTIPVGRISIKSSLKLFQIRPKSRFGEGAWH